MTMFQKFYPKSVLITGANRGLGLEFVKYFVTQKKLSQEDNLGYNPHVIACSRNMSHELEDLLEDVHHIDLDVTNQTQVEQAASTVSKIVETNGLNLLINNAAIMQHGKGVAGCSTDELRESLEINLIGAHSMIKNFHPLLKQAAKSQSDLPISFQRAGICNLSAELGSIRGTNKNFLYTAYKVSKAGLNMVTKCTAVDLIKDNIICISVHPGWAKTDLGGPNAPLSTNESIYDMVDIMNSCTKKHNGQFLKKGMINVSY